MSMQESGEERALVGNAADSKQVKEAGQKEKRHAVRIQAAWNSVLDTPQGRAVMYELIEQCGIYSGGYTGEQAHYNEGRRNIGLMILAKLNKRPDAYARMMSENNKEIE